MEEGNAPSAFKRRLKHIGWNLRLHKWATSLGVVVVLAIIVIVIQLAFKGPANDTQPANNSKNPAVLAYQKQLPDLKKTADDKPKDVAAQQNYAVALYATGNTKDAADRYKKAIALKSNDATLYNNLGNAQRDLKNYDDAANSYKKAININPQLLNPYVNLANLQIYTLNKPAEGIDTYQQALKALPGNEQIEILLGLAYEKQGQTDRAKQIYQEVLQANPGNAAARSNLQRLDG
jgi:tetratricopeptide (TPR) repeat protein